MSAGEGCWNYETLLRRPPARSGRRVGLRSSPRPCSSGGGSRPGPSRARTDSPKGAPGLGCRDLRDFQGPRRLANGGQTAPLPRPVPLAPPAARNGGQTPSRRRASGFFQRDVEGEINPAANSDGGAGRRERAAPSGRRRPAPAPPSICNLIDIWRREANQCKSIDVGR